MSRVVKNLDGGPHAKRWHGEFSQGSGSSRLRIKRGFDSKHKAMAWISEMTATHTQSLYFDPRMLVADFYRVWYRLFKERGLAPATQATYDATRKHLTQYLPTVTLGKVSRGILQGFFNVLGTNHAKETLRKDLMHLKAAFSTAVDEGVISKNPASRIKLYADGQRTTSEAEKFMSQSQYRRVRQYLVDWEMDLNDSKTMILMVISQTALRCGEAIALKKNDIDLQNHLLSVDESYDTCAGKIKEPKTQNAKRVVPMTEELAEKLHRWISLHDAWLEKRDIANPDDLIFLDKKGSLPRSTGVNYRYKMIQKKLGYKQQFHTHSFRHFLASEMIKNPNISIAYVSRFLGHASINVTQKYYLGLIPDTVESQRNVAVGAISNI
ncbi:site-specific integrase [Levilactobacillus brevis]|uniref:Site-specific integrase n=1 Tax=Levilactobacillus brevis TaxID=1580 RepID=A0AA41JTS3_LEVBR|nr:tyrosine-type recombinase/integrase [Levilactobacillus brevis]MBS0947616.1 site-specific integrase [Levilactobacillus brevis]MBS1010761.1 site-specific integrase [Levilactobacillus brevis]